MVSRTWLFFICLTFLAACQPDVGVVVMTVHPTLTAALPTTHPSLTATGTPMPPTPTPIPPVTIEPTSAPLPTPTATSGPMLPSASILFVRDGTLQQWSPHTGEVKALANGVNSPPIYAADLVVFLQEITPKQEFALMIFHIPTQTVHELLSTSTISLAVPYDTSFSISPNGRWLAYVSGDSPDSATVTVHEIVIENQQVSVKSPIFTVNSGAGWNWPHQQLTWPTGSDLSWSDQAGIWVANLSAKPINPVVAISPSTNTYLLPPLNPADQDKNPGTAYTKFIPYLWSSDGRHLLVYEHRYEESTYRVIERDTNRSFEIPDAFSGHARDNVAWLNETMIIVIRTDGSVETWHVNPDSEPLMVQDKTFQLPLTVQFNSLMPLADNQLRFSASALHGPAVTALYDLSIESGELTKISPDIPQHETALYWSPDGQYALSRELFFNSTMFLLDANGSTPIEMSLVFGLGSCCWHWYKLFPAAGPR